jgi:hypothetical protein
MTSISEYAAKVVELIDVDIKAGFVPAAVATFSDLHGHVDANDYALEAAPFSEFSGTWDEYMEHLNAIEAEVGRLLAERAGLRRVRITETLAPASASVPEPPADGRVYLGGYESASGIPSSCPVCGDDTDIHEWWDVKGGIQVNCDRK